MGVNKPYKFDWFSNIHGPKPYKFLGLRWAVGPGARPGPEESSRVGPMDLEIPVCASLARQKLSPMRRALRSLPSPRTPLRTPKIDPTWDCHELFPDPAGAQNRPPTSYAQDLAHRMLCVHKHGFNVEDSPCEFEGLEAVDVTKPHEFLWLGEIHGLTLAT
jgi:hypothetical protein